MDRDSVATAEESYNLHVVNKGLKSAGTWIVTVGECEVQELRVYADPLITDPKNLAHCLADFHGMSLSAVKRVGKKLRDCAEKRGSTYSPAD